MKYDADDSGNVKVLEACNLYFTNSHRKQLLHPAKLVKVELILRSQKIEIPELLETNYSDSTINPFLVFQQ